MFNVMRKLIMNLPQVLLAVDLLVFRVASICTALIILKYVATTVIQGAKKGKAGTRQDMIICVCTTLSHCHDRAPEDKIGSRKHSFRGPSKVDDPTVKQALHVAGDPCIAQWCSSLYDVI